MRPRYQANRPLVSVELDRYSRDERFETWGLWVRRGHHFSQLPGVWTSQAAAEVAMRQITYVLEAAVLFETIAESERRMVEDAEMMMRHDLAQRARDEEEDRKEQEKYDQRRERAKMRRKLKKMEREWEVILAKAAEKGLKFYGPYLHPEWVLQESYFHPYGKKWVHRQPKPERPVRTRSMW